MSIEVKIGDVFYRVEPTDQKFYHRVCRACEGKKELTVNGITFKCPVCYQEQEVLRVHGYFVRRYRVFSIEHFIKSSPSFIFESLNLPIWNSICGRLLEKPMIKTSSLIYKKSVLET